MKKNQFILEPSFLRSFYQVVIGSEKFSMPTLLDRSGLLQYLEVGPWLRSLSLKMMK